MPAQTLTFAIEIHPELIPDGNIGPLMEALENFGPILEQLGEIQGEYQREGFASQGAAYGEPWAALSPRTIAEKLRQGFSDQPMVREGALQDAIGQTIAVDGNSETTGIDLNAVRYAAYHQPSELGGTNSGGGRTPARILVAISAGEEQALQEALQQWLDDVSGAAGAVTVSIQGDE